MLPTFRLRRRNRLRRSDLTLPQPDLVVFVFLSFGPDSVRSKMHHLEQRWLRLLLSSSQGCHAFALALRVGFGNGAVELEMSRCGITGDLAFTFVRPVAWIP